MEASLYDSKFAECIDFYMQTEGSRKVERVSIKRIEKYSFLYGNKTPLYATSLFACQNPYIRQTWNRKVKPSLYGDACFVCKNRMVWKLWESQRVLHCCVSTSNTPQTHLKRSANVLQTHRKRTANAPQMLRKRASWRERATVHMCTLISRKGTDLPKRWR